MDIQNMNGMKRVYRTDGRSGNLKNGTRYEDYVARDSYSSHGSWYSQHDYSAFGYGNAFANKIPMAFNGSPHRSMMGPPYNNEDSEEDSYSSPQRRAQLFLLLTVLGVTFLVTAAITIAVTLVKKEGPKSVVQGKLTASIINREYTPAFNNTSSPEFIDLQEDLCSQVGFRLESDTDTVGYQGCTLDGVRNGSLVVVLIFQFSGMSKTAVTSAITNLFTPDDTSETVSIYSFIFLVSSVDIFVLTLLETEAGRPAVEQVNDLPSIALVTAFSQSISTSPSSFSEETPSTGIISSSPAVSSETSAVHEETPSISSFSSSESSTVMEASSSTPTTSSSTSPVSFEETLSISSFSSSESSTVMEASSSTPTTSSSTSPVSLEETSSTVLEESSNTLTMSSSTSPITPEVSTSSMQDATSALSTVIIMATSLVFEDGSSSVQNVLSESTNMIEPTSSSEGLITSSANDDVGSSSTSDVQPSSTIQYLHSSTLDLQSSQTKDDQSSSLFMEAPSSLDVSSESMLDVESSSVISESHSLTSTVDLQSSTPATDIQSPSLITEDLSSFSESVVDVESSSLISDFQSSRLMTSEQSTEELSASSTSETISVVETTPSSSMDIELTSSANYVEPSMSSSVDMELSSSEMVIEPSSSMLDAQKSTSLIEEQSTSILGDQSTDISSAYPAMSSTDIQPSSTMTDMPSTSMMGDESTSSQSVLSSMDTQSSNIMSDLKTSYEVSDLQTSDPVSSSELIVKPSSSIDGTHIPSSLSMTGDLLSSLTLEISMSVEIESTSLIEVQSSRSAQDVMSTSSEPQTSESTVDVPVSNSVLDEMTMNSVTVESSIHDGSSSLVGDTELSVAMTTDLMQNSATIVQSKVESSVYESVSSLEQSIITALTSSSLDQSSESAISDEMLSSTVVIDSSSLEVSGQASSMDSSRYTSEFSSSSPQQSASISIAGSEFSPTQATVQMTSTVSDLYSDVSHLSSRSLSDLSSVLSVSFGTTMETSTVELSSTIEPSSTYEMASSSVLLPVYALSMDDVIAVENVTTTLVCNLEGNLTVISVKFLKDEEELTGTEQNEDNTIFQYILSSPTCTDSGIYHCMVEGDEANLTTTANVSIQVPPGDPTVTLPFEIVEERYKEASLFICKYKEGIPAAEVKWTATNETGFVLELSSTNFKEENQTNECALEGTSQFYHGFTMDYNASSVCCDVQQGETTLSACETIYIVEKDFCVNKTGKHAHPYSSRKWIECVNEVVYMNQCTEGFCIDLEADQCLACGGSTLPDDPFSCVGRNGDYVPKETTFPNNCGDYNRCVNGAKHPGSCAGASYLSNDTSTGLCTAEYQNSYCYHRGGGVTTTTAVPSRCECGAAISYIPTENTYPDNCGAYVWCVNGVQYLRGCATGLVVQFDPFVCATNSTDSYCSKVAAGEIEDC